tara:strand:- start:424 stop:696 length:273 start_codon:yes stop_codon:yes gene_type:complete
MEVNVLEESKDRLKFEIQGEDHTLCNALRNELWNVKGVEVAGYTKAHPLVARPVFIVETDGKEDPRKVLLKAVENLKEENKQLKTVIAKL